MFVKKVNLSSFVTTTSFSTMTSMSTIISSSSVTSITTTTSSSSVISTIITTSSSTTYFKNKIKVFSYLLLFLLWNVLSLLEDFCHLSLVHPSRLLLYHKHQLLRMIQIQNLCFSHFHDL